MNANKLVAHFELSEKLERIGFIYPMRWIEMPRKIPGLNCLCIECANAIIDKNFEKMNPLDRPPRHEKKDEDKASYRCQECFSNDSYVYLDYELYGWQ